MKRSLPTWCLLSLAALVISSCTGKSNETAGASPAGTASTPPASEMKTLVLREISLRTFSGTINDEETHPVLVIDDLKRPRPIGPGRGVGGYVFLNNHLYSWDDNKEIGMMHGMCWTIDHGPDGPWTGEMAIGLGGPFPSSCQLYYQLDNGTLVGHGLVDLNAMERDEQIPLPLVGGTGAYMGARGQVTIVQDPPGQPITYKIVLEYSVP